MNSVLELNSEVKAESPRLIKVLKKSFETSLKTSDDKTRLTMFTYVRVTKLRDCIKKLQFYYNTIVLYMLRSVWPF